jgi:hypothetical protein
MRGVVVSVLGLAAAAAFCDHADADDVERVTVQATAIASHDSNVAHSDAALAAQRGVTPADDVFSPGVSIDLSLPLGLEEVFLKGTAAYNIYARNTQLNSQDVDLTGGVAARLLACKATLSGSVEDARTDLAQLAVGVTRNIENIETVGVSAECGREGGFGPSFSITQRYASNSAPQLFPSDSRSTTANAGIAYRRPQFGELELVGTFEQTDYPNRQLQVDQTAQQDGYRAYSVGVLYDRRLGARIEGTFEVGYVMLAPHLSGVRDYRGPYYRADVSWRISPRLQAQLQATRSPNPTNVSEATYDLRDLFSGSIDYAITPKLKLQFTGSDTTDSYTGDGFVSGVTVQHQVTRVLTVSSHLQLSRRASIELWFTREVGDADIKSYDYTDSRAGLSVYVAI